MALEQVLANIPGLAGYLARQQFDQRQSTGQLGQLLGIANLVETQKARAQQAEQQRLHGLLYQAQADRLARQDAEEQQATQRLGGLSEQLRSLQQPTQQADAADNLTQLPGLSQQEALRKILPQMVLDPNRHIAERGARLEGSLEATDARRDAAAQRAELQAAAIEQRRDAAMANATNAAERNRIYGAFTQQANALRAVAQSNRRDPMMNVLDPENPGKVIGMPESDYKRRTEAGEKLYLPGGIAGTNQELGRRERLSREMETAHPNVKLLNTTKPFFMAATEYMSDLAKAKQEGKSAPATSASDRALFFQYQKMLDPSDKVSEGDYKGLLRLGGLDERFVQYLQGLTEGQMLPDRVRNDMYAAMRRNFKQLNSQVKQVEERYKDRAKNLGLDPSTLTLISEDNP